MSTPRVWFITGCSSGFGRALAEKVLARGDTLIATARDTGKLQDLVKRFPETCHPFTLDVSQSTQVRGVIEQALARVERLDVVVNNAGYGLIGALEECTEAQMLRNFDTNLFGAVHVMRAVLPILRQQRSGHILNISAAAAITNYAGFSIYGGAKFALEGVSESVAAEVKPLGIKVTLVEPGPFRTDFISRSLDRAPEAIGDYAATTGKFAAFLEKMNGQQPGDPDKAAEAILQVVASENPPLRLALGKYAVEKTERFLKTRARELETWKAVGLSTDFVSSP